MSIFNLEKGTKESRSILVPGLSTELTVTTVCGIAEGPRVLITAGIHNEEYVGIETANRLARELNPEEMSGCVVIIHICNPTGFSALSPDVIPEDGQNLNRCFPGSAGGAPSHRLAHFITEEFLEPASCLIDLHSGGGREVLCPHVYYQAMAGESLEASSKKLAALADVDYMIASDSYTGSAFSHAAYHNIPSILMERGGMAMWSEAEICDYLADIRRVLHHLGVLKNSVLQQRTPKTITQTDYFRAEHSGCWYPAKKAGETAVEGETLGVIKDLIGKELSSVKASENCTVLYQIGSLAIVKGEALIACGKI